MIGLVPAGPRTLGVRVDGRVVATLALGVPGEAEPPDDPDELLRTRSASLLTRVRLFEDVDATSLIVTLENGGVEAVEVPSLGFAIEPDPDWSGWSWTSDTNGFIVLAGPADAVVLQLRQGFLRAAQERPVFGAGVAAFHLVRPGELASGARVQTVLRLSRVPDAEAAASLLPAWLPPLVEPEGTEIPLTLPDVGVLPGPGVDATLTGDTLLLRGTPGHRAVALHGVRGVQSLRLTWVPALAGGWLADAAQALRARRPSAVSTATAAVVAEALARGAVLDREAVVDWLEREDWLARGDALGVATASALGLVTDDAALLSYAWEALDALPIAPGYGLVTLRVWLALLSTGRAPDLAPTLLRRTAGDALTALELSLLGGGEAGTDEPRVRRLVERLGGSLPGQPVRLAVADAARAVGVLRLCPEGWGVRTQASATAEKAAGLLLGDYADGLHAGWDGLAWLLVGQLGS